jgi:hypothetical protein
MQHSERRVSLPRRLFNDAVSSAGHAVVEVLRYKPEGRGFDGVIGIFDWHNPSGRTMTLG